MHIRFLPCLERGQAYVEAWVHKWEAELRVSYRPGEPMIPSRPLPSAVPRRTP